MPTISNTATCAAEAAAEWWTETLRTRREDMGASALGRTLMGCPDTPTDKELSFFKKSLRSLVSTKLEIDGVMSLEAKVYTSEELQEAARAAGFAPPWPKTIIMTITVDTVTVLTDKGEEVIWQHS